jgi:predicted nucleotidyltransferase
MGDVEKKLTSNEKIFFNNLSIYIDKEIYFYGSIQRPDYLKGKSDIDIDIFTENESSTIQKLCNFLNKRKSDFKKTIYKINNTMVYGYKTNYIDEINKINVEISLYNDKYKTLLLYEHNNCRYLPFYVTICLIIIKFFYYNLGILPNKIYNRLKRFLMNRNDELKFITINN